MSMIQCIVKSVFHDILNDSETQESCQMKAWCWPRRGETPTNCWTRYTLFLLKELCFIKSAFGIFLCDFSFLCSFPPLSRCSILRRFTSWTKTWWELQQSLVYLAFDWCWCDEMLLYISSIVVISLLIELWLQAFQLDNVVTGVQCGWDHQRRQPLDQWAQVRDISDSSLRFWVVKTDEVLERRSRGDAPGATL